MATLCYLSSFPTEKKRTSSICPMSLYTKNAGSEKKVVTLLVTAALPRPPAVRKERTLTELGLYSVVIIIAVLIIIAVTICVCELGWKPRQCQE